jgi:hypothetical protein
MPDDHFRHGRDSDYHLADRDQMREMWNRWWYDEFDFALDVPEDAELVELEVGGERFDLALLSEIAPLACEGFKRHLPYERQIVHCVFFGHAAYWLDRIDLGPTVLENRTTRFLPGEFIWEPWIKEITFAYGRWAEVRMPTPTIWEQGVLHPQQAQVFAKIVPGQVTRFAHTIRRTRYEGSMPMTARLKAA